MIVTLLSAFRDNANVVPAYGERVGALEDLLAARGDVLYCIWGEGDSADDTRNRLLEELTLSELVDVAHGGPKFGSVVNAERFRQLAQVWNTLWARIPVDGDVVVFVEPDLIWKPEDMLTLIDQTADYPVVTPMIMLRRNGHRHDQYYDVWASRKDGKMFRSMPPYFRGWPTSAMVELDSAGSCLVMRGELARQLTWPEKDVVVGLCKTIYQLGGSVWLDPNLAVYHP